MIEFEQLIASKSKDLEAGFAKLKTEGVDDLVTQYRDSGNGDFDEWLQEFTAQESSSGRQLTNEDDLFEKFEKRELDMYADVYSQEIVEHDEYNDYFRDLLCEHSDLFYECVKAARKRIARETVKRDQLIRDIQERIINRFKEYRDWETAARVVAEYLVDTPKDEWTSGVKRDPIVCTPYKNNNVSRMGRSEHE